jgi:hypothetical protein
MGFWGSSEYVKTNLLEPEFNRFESVVVGLLLVHEVSGKKRTTRILKK